MPPVDVKYELDSLRPNLILEETEDSWEKIAKSLQSMIKLCENGAYDASPVELVNIIKTSHRPIISAMNSERTRLCMVPMDLMAALGTAMGRDFEQLLPLFLPALLTQCARTNKVIINRAKSTILTIIEVTQLASVLSYFLQNIKDKSATMKVVIAEGTLACLNSCNPPDLEKEARTTEVESIIRVSARDNNADVRKLSRKIFESYKILLPSRVQNFTAPLSPTTKKYLDIKTTTITTQKSSSNLRANTNLKAEIKPSAPVSSSATNATKPGHSRTASSSTVSVSTSATGSQMRNQPPILTRVTRKEPTTSVAAPYVPVRPVQPSRVMADAQKSNPQRSTNAGASRPTTTQDKPMPPLRSKPSIISRSTTGTAGVGAAPTSGVPHRMQLNSRPDTGAAAGPSSQPLPSTGPRRIPMPPPPPPAPKKDTEGAKRPASRVDNAVSTASNTGRPAIVPPAPVKKRTVSTLSSSMKDRVTATNPVAVTRPKSSTSVPKVGTGSGAAASTSSTTAKAAAAAAATSSSGAATSTKLLPVAKAKPLWGRSTVTAAKPLPASSASQKVQTAKAVVRKPSTKFAPTSKNAAAAGPPKKKPVTPAMIALPPSPTPEEAAPEASVEVAQQNENEDQNEQVDLGQNTDHPAFQANASMAPVVFVPVIETTELEEEDNEQTIHQDEQVEAAVRTVGFATPITTTTEGETVSVPNIEAAQEVVDDNDEDLANDDPHTPQQCLMPPPSKNVMASKTPISALLSSIERGFKYDYSPITPLSPADNYLPNVTGEGTPYSHATHAPHLKGPMQSFNHALHVPGHNGMFDGFAVEKIKKDEELVRGDIGVVQLSEYNKIYMAPGLPGLDDGRLAFVELNRS